jgi:hypothetical protein
MPTLRTVIWWAMPTLRISYSRKKPGFAEETGFFGATSQGKTPLLDFYAGKSV